MSKARGGLGWMALTLLSLGACAAELSVPDRVMGGGAGGGRADAPSDGITGSYSEGGALPEPLGPPPRGTDRPNVAPSAPSAPDGGAPAAPNPSSKAGSSAVSAPLPESPPAAGIGGDNSGNSGGAGGAGPTEPPPPPPPPLPPPLPELFFSEYLEGTGSTKALEIYVAAADSLEGCDLLTYFNGGLEPGRLALHGPVMAGDVYVLCSSQLAQAEPERCDRSTNLTFNGNDSVALVCAGTVLDVFGQIGFDPGAAWGDGLSVDHTLRRNCGVKRGRVDGSAPFDPSLEWLALPVDPSDLGSRSCP